MGVEKAMLFLLCLHATITVRCVSSKEYKLGLLLPYSNNIVLQLENGIFSGTYYAAAITLAIEKVNNDPNLLPDSKLSFVWNNTQCNQTQMVEQQHWQIKQGVNGFIGPACHGRKAARVAAKHNLAVISFGSQDARLSDKILHPNFARTNPASYKAIMKILAILEAKSWTQVSIVYKPNRFWKVFKRYLTARLMEKNIQVNRKIKLHDEDLRNTTVVAKAVDSFSQVTIFLLPFKQTREIVTMLERLILLGKRPKYGFVSVLLDRSYVKSAMQLPFKWFFSVYHYYTPQRTRITKAAFNRLFLITLKPVGEDTVGYKAFKDDLKIRSSQKPFYSDSYEGCAYRFNGKCLFDKSTSIPPYSGAYLYDAVIQFAEALHAITRTGKQPSGVNIINHLKKKHFIGIDGHEHQFDENADVEYDFSILKLKKDENDNLNMLPIDIRNEIL